MKKAFTFLILLLLIASLICEYYFPLSPVNRPLILKASLDDNIAYAVITASMLGVIKLKKTPVYKSFIKS